jgi:uncharacterized protein (TIGR02271 family)
MNGVYQGMIVTDRQGPVGVVQAVEENPTTGDVRVVVRRDDGETQILTSDRYTVTGDTLHINEAREPQTATPAGPEVSEVTDVAPGEEMVIPVIREEAAVRTRKVERGGVRVHKRVKEREETLTQPVTRETVHVERVPIGQAVEVAPQVREEGDTLIIPVLEEVLVVEKRLVLKEELRITRQRTTDNEEVRVVLREEEASVEEIDRDEGERS